MTAHLLDGKALAGTIKDKIKAENTQNSKKSLRKHFLRAGVRLPSPCFAARVKCFILDCENSITFSKITSSATGSRPRRIISIFLFLSVNTPSNPKSASITQD